MNEQYKNIIYKMISGEVERIIKLHGQFVDNHHFYGVLLEELEESKEEFSKIPVIVDKIWIDIRKKEDVSIVDLTSIENICEKTIQELIKVAAVCIKLRNKFFKN